MAKHRLPKRLPSDQPMTTWLLGKAELPSKGVYDLCRVDNRIPFIVRAQIINSYRRQNPCQTSPLSLKEVGAVLVRWQDLSRITKKQCKSWRNSLREITHGW